MIRSRCIGSGVPGDWFEYGHWILPGTESGMFPRIEKVRSRYSSRCYLCASVRRYWKRSTDATAKATKTHREHAAKMVKFGFAPDVPTAIAIMNANGVTVAWIAETALEAIGKPCPGRCFTPTVVNGKPACHDHIIAEWGDLQFDWRDPENMLSRENAGWLCPSCNKQKGRRNSWTKFMARQHAIRMNFLHAERLPIQDTLFDLPEAS